MPFEDGFGRVHDELRISITDRCNLRCAYCMPVEPVWFDRKEILTYEEIASIARVAAAGGVRRFRITGGEPLVRRDVESLVAMLAATPGLEDLGMTTNGALLAPVANRLADAGLRRINVSLHILRPERFRSLTGRDALRDVLDGIEAASRAGLPKRSTQPATTARCASRSALTRSIRTGRTRWSASPSSRIRTTS